MIIKNPLLNTDIPDIDIIKHNDCYYMVTTTMFFTPGAPILRSKNLKNWEIVSYIFDKIADNDIYELKNGKNAYGAGQWATSLCEHNGLFYACFVCNDLHKTFVYYTDDLEKSNWDRYELEGFYHDPSFLFFESKSYLVYGNGDIRIVELNDDLSHVVEGTDSLLFSTDKEGIMLRCEGCRAYVRNGYIYLCFIEWPNQGIGNGRRREVCYRAQNLESTFERKIVFDDDMGYNNCGIAQGVLIEAFDGNWYSMLFQDHGAVGRIPYLIPMSWENDWPVIGVNGKAPERFEIQYKEFKTNPISISDTFNHHKNIIPFQFQWNHNPIDEGWSFTDRPGYLRLRNMQTATDLLTARNTLTERTIGPKSVFTIEGDYSGMKGGDYAGLAAFMGKYALIGLTKSNGDYYIVSKHRDQDEIRLNTNGIAGFKSSKFWVRITFDFTNDTASFYYSIDGDEFISFGETLNMEYTLDVFVGYRIGIFSFGTKNLGGVVDFRNLNLFTP